MGRLSAHIETDKEEFYQLLTYTDDVNLDRKLEEWQSFYNYHRPHRALSGKTPYELLREKMNLNLAEDAPLLFQPRLESGFFSTRPPLHMNTTRPTATAPRGQPTVAASSARAPPVQRCTLRRSVGLRPSHPVSACCRGAGAHPAPRGSPRRSASACARPWRVRLGALR